MPLLDYPLRTRPCTGTENTGMSYEMGGTILSKTLKEKDLGVTMNANMKVSEQCRIAASKGNQVLGMIRRNVTYKEKSLIISLFLFFPLLGVRCCLQLFHRLICYSSPPPSVSCLLLPVSLLSCLLHISLYTVLPSQSWPPSSPPALLS